MFSQLSAKGSGELQKWFAAFLEMSCFLQLFKILQEWLENLENCGKALKWIGGLGKLSFKDAPVTVFRQAKYFKTLLM